MFKIKQKHLVYQYLPVGLCFSFGMILTIALSMFVKKWEDTNNQAQFQQRVSNLTTALNRTVNRYTEVLYSLRDFYNTSPELVSRSQFNTFTERAVSSYRGIQALEWAKIVSNSEKITFEQSIQKSGYPKFQINERDRNGKSILAKPRLDYIPVLYINPWANNEVALGFDLASDRERRIALENARDSGDITATGKIRLVQEQKDQYGFLVFLAIYKNENRLIPSKIKTRKEVEGYILGVFRVADVIEESLQGINTDIDFTISYENSSQGFLGFYKSPTKSFLSKLPTKNSQIDTLCLDRLSCSRKITVGDRVWLIQFQPTESYGESNKSWLPESTLLIGLILSGALSFYIMGAIIELERTRELSELKLRLFSMVSHEFRTPLSTILISAQSLETDISEQTLKISRRIQSATKRMDQLLADILTLSRAEVGNLEFVPEIIDLQRFCTQLLDGIEHSFDRLPQINFRMEGKINPAFLDRKLLSSLIINLLENAIKYSFTEAPVDFLITRDRHRVIIKVSDRGIGIAKDEQLRIFEDFYRGQNVGEISGNGLGMSVVKICVDLHGGRIDLESELGKGTTFIVTLPQKD